MYKGHLIHSLRYSKFVELTLYYSLTDKWELEADLLYSMQGYKDKIYTTALEQNLNDENYTVTSHYINPLAELNSWQNV